MPGRQLLSEDDLIDPRYGSQRPEMVRRRAVLRETLDRFATAAPPRKYHILAHTNLQRWFDTRESASDTTSIFSLDEPFLIMKDFSTNDEGEKIGYMIWMDHY